MTIRCWICGSDHMKIVKPSGIRSDLTSAAFEITDHLYGVTGELSRCGACGFLQCSGLTDVLGFYEGLEDPAYEAGSTERARQFRMILQRVEKFRRGGRLLDIGAGTGILLGEAQSLGYDAEGVEPSRWLFERGQEKGLRMFRGAFPHPETPGPYDVVTLVDVIEHVPDPVGLLREIAGVLKPDGIAVVVTPDLKSIAARLMGWKWWHFRVAHIGYFDRRTLTAAAKAAGLRIRYTGRPTWYFKAEYLIDRVQEYLPRALRFKCPDSLKQMVLPLDLRDSLMVIVSKSDV